MTASPAFGRKQMLLFVSSLLLMVFSGSSFVHIHHQCGVQQSVWSKKTETTFPRLRMSTAPPPLEKMTIKQLQKLLKESEFHERGLLSRLRRKQDLVDYLHSRLHRDHPNALVDDAPSTLEKEREVDIPEEPSMSRRSTEQRPLIGAMPKMIPLLSPRDAVDQQQQREDGSKTAATNRQYLRSDPYLRAAQYLYPPFLTGDFSELEEGEDVRQHYHPMLRNASSSEMEVTFLGTASCVPGVTRGVSCLALRIGRNRQQVVSASTGTVTSDDHQLIGTFMFDVGEGTQLQLQRSSIKATRITRIFLTHSHGDHSFGLPGLLCLIGKDRDKSLPPIEIYGPEGLRSWLRVAIRYASARVVAKYRVHELKNVPVAPEWAPTRHKTFFFKKNHNARWRDRIIAGFDPESWVTNCDGLNIKQSHKFGEADGGRDIFPDYDHPKAVDGAPVWKVEDNGVFKVFAAPMSHGVPCVGYVVEEESRPGRLRKEVVEPIVKRNLQGLKEAGFDIPMKAMAVVKGLPEGSSYTFPDGTVITQEEAVEPARAGRKVVICGDTCSARAIKGLAMDADLLVHEATNAFFHDINIGTTELGATNEAVRHGHSTPRMAAKFAHCIRAKKLVLNHFSPRYMGDPSLESIATMIRIEEQAMESGHFPRTDVAASWDFMSVPVPQRE